MNYKTSSTNSSDSLSLVQSPSTVKYMVTFHCNLPTDFISSLQYIPSVTIRLCAKLLSQVSKQLEATILASTLQQRRENIEGKKRKETQVEAHGRKNRIFWTRGRRQMKTK